MSSESILAISNNPIIEEKKMEEPKRGKTRLRPEKGFLIIDFYEDRNKFRWIFPLATLLLFIFVVFTIIVSTTEERKEPSKVKIDIEPANYQIFGHYKSNIRDPGITVLDKFDDPVSGINITIVPVSFTATVRNDRPKCDFDNRKSKAGTYDALRIFDVCQFEMSGTHNVSDENGAVKFPQFRILSGPEGIYKIVYAYSSTIQSPSTSIYFQSDVFRINAINSPQRTIKAGEMLNPQPQLQILNASGQPIKGKKIQALSWPEPSLSLTYGVQSFTISNKYAILNNTISEASDEEGIVHFTNLTLIGTMNFGLYIVFICDGSIMRSWHYPPSMNSELMYYPLVKPPIYINAENYEPLAVNITNIANLQTTIIEGNILNPQPIISIINRIRNFPIVNVPVFAVLVGYEEEGVLHYFPEHLQYQEIGTYVKRLIKPVSAIYHENFTDPFADWLFTPKLTDLQGQVEFEGLTFTIKGNLGITGARTYLIKFLNEGTETEAYKIKVQTSIQSVTFVNTLSSEYVSDINEAYEIYVLLRILNSEGNGVPGKSISEISFVNTEQSEIGGIYIKALTDYSEEAYSDEDGFLSVFIKILSIALINDNVIISQGSIKVNMDGVIAYSAQITLFPSGWYQGCFYLRLIDSPNPKNMSEYIQKAGEVFTKSITVQAIDNLGIPVSGLELTFTPLTDSYLSISNPPAKEVFLQLDDQPVSKIRSTTNASGYVQFDNIKVLSAFFGTYFYNIMGTTKVNSARSVALPNSCYLTQPLPIFINNPLKFLVLLEDSYDTFEGNTYAGDENITVTFQCYDLKFGSDQYSVFAGEVSVGVDILQLPPTYFTLYRNNPEISSYIELLTPSPTTITESDIGMIEIKVRVKESFPGKWALGVVINGIHSPSFMFTIKSPVTALNILSQPSLGDMLVTRHIGRILPTMGIQVKAGNTDFKIVSYTVIAMIEAYNSTKDFGMIDISSFSTSTLNDHPSFVPMAPIRQAQTDSTGIAYFREITLLDINQTTGCFRMKFVMGEPGMSIQSELSNPFCYENTFKFSVMPSYSKLIGEQANFPVSVGATVTLNPVMGNDLTNAGVYIISIVPAVINGMTIPEDQALGYASKYLENNVCVFSQGSCVFGGCELQVITATRNKPLSFNVYFDNFKWNKPTIKDTFSLRFLSYLPKTDNPTTATITATTVPNTIMLMSQPPSKILIGDIFQIVVLGILGDGSGLPRATITTNITQSTNVESLDKTSVESMINLFGNQDMGIDILSQLYRQHRVALDSSRAKGITDSMGIAKMNLKIRAGKSGYYALLFESGATKSLPTNNFYLQNPVKAVTLTNNEDMKQKIEVDFMEKDGEYAPTYGELATLPIIQLSPISSEYERYVIGRGKEFEIYVIDKESIEKAEKALEEKGLNATKNMSLYDINTYKNLKNPSTSSEELKGLWTAISKGAQAVGEIKDNADVAVQYTSPNETSTGFYEFSNITIEWKKPGEYYLIFVIIGIESFLTPSITVVEKSLTTSEKVVMIFEYVFTYVIFIFSIIMNIANINKYFKLFTLLCCCTYMGLIHLSQRTLIYAVLTYISLGLLLLATLKSFIDEILKKKESAHYIVRHKILMEYAYQHLFMRVSKSWNPVINEELQKTSIVPDDSLNISQEQPKLVSATSTSTFIPDQRSPNNYEPYPTQIIETPREKNEKTVIYPYSPTTQNALVPTKEGNIYKIEEFPDYMNRGIVERTKWVVLPFSYNLRERVVVDAMYYPQRFIAPLLIGVVIFIYFAILLYNTVWDMIQNLGGIRVDLTATLNKFIMSAIISGRYYLNYEFTDQELKSYYDVVENVNEHLSTLQFTLELAFAIGCTLGIIITFGAFIIIIFDFKDQVIKLRRGESDLAYKFKDSKSSVACADQFPGNFISNCVMAFILIVSIFTLVGAILFHKLFWETVYEYRRQILIFLLPKIIVMIKDLILKSLLYDSKNDLIKRPFGAQVNEFFNFFLLILGGVLTSIGRFLIAIVGLCIGMTRLDRPLLSQWFLQIYYLDSANKSYIGMLHAYHTFNNPIHYAARECFFRSMTDKSQFILTLGDKAKEIDFLAEKSAERMKLIRARNKLSVAIVLMKHPDLFKYRKKHIAWVKELEEILKKQREEKGINKYESVTNAGMQMNGSENQVVLQIGRGEPKRISVQSLEPLKGLNDSSSD